MAKRTTFYVTTALFEMDISSKAKLVLTYLSRTSNKDGTCYPSIASIARCCGCCKNTVRKALRELESAGIVSVTPSFAESKNGKRRRQANVYTLRIPGSPDAPAPVHGLLEGGAANGAEVNNDSNTIIAVPSVGITGDDGNDLERILAKLHLDTFYDQGFARSIGQAIRTMYRAEEITVKKQRIPRNAVRDRLRMLTIDHIDFIEAQLGNRYDPVTCGESYLISCLYNAPMDCMVNARRAL
jgi:hypothetical protein